MNKCTRICAMNDPDKGCLLGLGDNCTVGPDKEYQRPAEVESGSVREKLLDLIIEAKKADTEDAPFSEFLADFLIANGVTIQEWVPVSERLPNEKDVNKFGEVLAVTKNGDRTAYPYYMMVNNRNYFLYWMPLSVLPTPPKGECAHES